jgi:uncharacterized protein YecE (DUF72 family)
VKTAADRLSFYASAFPIVEMNATYYALPSERNAHLWVERTPPGFLFNIRAFGLFTHHPVPVERLPEAVKTLLPDPVAEKKRVYLRDVPDEARTLIWEMQVQAPAPLTAAGKLGCMLSSSRTGSRRDEAISSTCSSFASGSSGRSPSSSAAAAG